MTESATHKYHTQYFNCTCRRRNGKIIARMKKAQITKKRNIEAAQALWMDDEDDEDDDDVGG
jgi:hypothetical protein